MIRSRVALVPLVISVLCLALPASAFVKPERPARQELLREPAAPSPRAELVPADEASPIGAAARAFRARKGGEWMFLVDRRTGYPELVQGSGIPMLPGSGNQLGTEALAAAGLAPGEAPTPGALEALARAFIETEHALLVPPSGELVLDDETSQVREDGRLVSLYFDWKIDGVPVEGAAVFLRWNHGNLTQFGASRIGDVRELDVRPTVSADKALADLFAYTGDGELARLEGPPELLIQPEDDPAADGRERLAGGLEYRLIWRIVYRLTDAIETWEGRVDAHTGEVVGFQDLNRYARAVGGVYPRTIYQNNETRAPMPYDNVVVAGSSTSADSAGSFAYTGGSLVTGLNGLYFNTSCQGCSTPSQPDVRTSLGIGWLDFGFGGHDQFGNGASTPADRNTFYHLQKTRRIVTQWLPGLSYLAQTNYTSNVNINNFCNAVYNGAVNFYRSGGDCNNTGEIADVVYHEWGHGLDSATHSGDGGTGEGTADVNSMQITHSALVGPGFRVTGAPVRNLDRATSSMGTLTAGNIGSICDGAVHCVGQIFGQTAWDLAQALVAKYGYYTGWRQSARLYYTSLADQGTWNPSGSSPIYSAYLNADDNDGNLANGTPNAAEIYAAFNVHQIAIGAQPASSPLCSAPAQPVLTVTPDCDRFSLQWNAVAGVDHYTVLRSELLADTAPFAVAQVGAGATSWVDSEVVPGVAYWYTVMAVSVTGCESRVESPSPAQLIAQPILSVSAVVVDDTPRGNRSGFADPGEEVDLRLTLANFGEIEAQAVSGSIVALTPGVTVLSGTSGFGSVVENENVESSAVLRFRTDEAQVACGSEVRFQFVPSEQSGCSDAASYFAVRIGQSDGGGGFVCDLTPACYVAPTFAGLQSAAPGGSCAEVDLAWPAAQTHCTNATLRYNVYRSTDPGFVPDPASLVISGLAPTSLHDTFLQPGQTYHYVVRALDSRSGEESNTIRRTVVSPTSPDLVAPLFGGLASALTGQACGETVLSWVPALESCHAPVSYEVYRSTDPGFVPGPSNRVGSTLSPSFVDAALDPAVSYTYVVRARDGAGNETTGDPRLTVSAAIVDLIRAHESFEATNANWKAVAPNDATTGNWAWGDPNATTFQPGDDVTSGGVNCWFTGLASGPSAGDYDVDGGTTTLRTDPYDMSGMVNPAVRYWRWFTNDRGGSPGNDPFLVEVSNNDGATWTQLESVNSGTPLAWVPREFALNGLVTTTNQMRFRFTAQDLGAGSLVEAGIDEFEVVDLDRGCTICPPNPQGVGTIYVHRAGNDVVIDWTGDPTLGARFAVYKLGGAGFSEAVRIGTTTGRTFVHPGAATAEENYSYKVSAIDSCGNESGL